MSETSDSLYDQAVDHIQAGRLPEALTAIEQSLMEDKDDAQTWRLYSMVLKAAGRHEDSTNAAAKAQQLAPDDAEAHLMKAAEATLAGNLPAAISHYEDALEADGERAEIWTSYSLALMEEGYKKDALEASEKAVTLDADLAYAWYARGRVLRLNEDPEPSVGAFEKAVSLDPALPAAWHEHGMVLTTLGRFADALKSFEKVLALQPDDPAATQAKTIVSAQISSGS